MRNIIDKEEFNAGERLYLGETKIGRANLNEHLDRYKFAVSLMPENAVVLDAACGTGYGSQMLAEKAKKVIGEHALIWGKERHKLPNLEFIKGDLNKSLPFTDGYFDMITSFETLEHVANHENILSEFHRVLKPDGKLIISTPDKEILTNVTHTENKFHIHELSKKEFIDVLNSHFFLKELYGQTLYVPQSPLKRAISSVAKLDVFNLRGKIVKALNLRLMVHWILSAEKHTPIVKISPNEANRYYILVAVCNKNA
ncbi:MAG: class I SAM-dependent methyltransferase [Minisyncoccia bacterium]